VWRTDRQTDRIATAYTALAWNASRNKKENKATIKTYSHVSYISNFTHQCVLASILCFMFYASNNYARRRLLCFHYVPMSRCLSRCPVPTSAFLSLRTNTERISMRFAGGHYYHQQMNWLHFGRNCAKDKGEGYDRKFESTPNRCCHVANDCTRMQRRRHHMTARGL